MRKNRVKNLLEEKLRHYRHKRLVIFGLSLVILLMIYFFKEASFTLRAVSMVAFLLFFYTIDHVFDIRFKKYHYLFIIVIAAGGLLLSPLYFVYPNYDKVQHFVQPMLICSIIFHLLDKLPVKLKWKWVLAFFVTVAILGLFEIGEYTLDYFFDLKLQGVYLRDIKGIEKFNLLMDPLDDTMVDLVLGISGTGLFMVAGFWIMRRRLQKMALKN